MVSSRQFLLYLFAVPLVSIANPVSAASCDTATGGQSCYFTNAFDFGGNSFQHISFDTTNEQSELAIETKYNASISSFTISGGNAAIRPSSEHSTVFGGEGTAGGAVSGDHRIDWGYFGLSTVVITFRNPVDAVGAYFGGDDNYYDYAAIEVLFEDGTSHRISRRAAGMPAVPNGSTACEAINGFLGIDSNGGPMITQVTFSEFYDAGSLDSIMFGTAVGGSQGPGPVLFPENGATGCPAMPPVIPGAVPPPGALLPVAIAGTSLDASGALQLDGTSSLNPNNATLTYTWDIFGVGISTGPVVPVSNLAPGTYTVELTVSDSVNSSTDTMMFAVVPGCVAPTPNGATTQINSIISDINDMTPQEVIDNFDGPQAVPANNSRDEVVDNLNAINLAISAFDYQGAIDTARFLLIRSDGSNVPGDLVEGTFADDLERQLSTLVADLLAICPACN